MRKNSFGENYELKMLDHFGEFLSKRNFTSILKKNNNDYKVMLDVGCGYNAKLTAGIRNKFRKSYLADIALNPDLVKQDKKDLELLQGPIEQTIKKIPSQSIDFIVANNVLEHLKNPQSTLDEFRRVIRSNGLIFINVPNWKGKFFLEIAAFRLGLAPEEEMQDHMNYYSRQELWTLVRRSDFNPRAISITSKKFFLNSTAVITMRKN
jgi:ubiquinone/menaquinone biosynthesis C-methylase UbiE